MSLIIIVILSGCARHALYTYRTTMQPATIADSLFYENDSIQIKFSLEPKYIAFHLYNKLNDGILLKWDEISISIKEKTYKVIHTETGSFKINRLQMTSIPPHSYLDDVLIPIDGSDNYSVEYNSITYAPDIFPNYIFNNEKNEERIKYLPGAYVIIYMPLYIGNKYTSRPFSIRINAIEPPKRFSRKN
ncbi:MAG TPA: hypothetical protein VGO09_04340 [Flavisolibacter sp.]|nr:hypothetical protein [Flavisolibacter sp.]